MEKEPMEYQEAVSQIKTVNGVNSGLNIAEKKSMELSVAIETIKNEA